MPIIPQINFPDLIQVTEGEQGRKCPVWDFETGDFQKSISGRIIVTQDERTILGQLARASLLTQRGAYAIHDFSFGCDILSIIGYDSNYVRTRIPKMVREALNDVRFAGAAVSVSEEEDEGVRVDVNIQTYRGQTLNEVLSFGG